MYGTQFESLLACLRLDVLMVPKDMRSINKSSGGHWAAVAADGSFIVMYDHRARSGLRNDSLSK